MMRYDFVANQQDNQFYPVCESDIKEVEGTLGLKFPFELRKFLLEVGYGFIQGSEYNIKPYHGPFFNQRR